ncbi:MAG: hypothetical protein JST76_10745 [Bacteroidetes bacterium]|nr:hypothetical protein [Bacteroidota bacterium]
MKNQSLIVLVISLLALTSCRHRITAWTNADKGVSLYLYDSFAVIKRPYFYDYYAILQRSSDRIMMQRVGYGDTATVLLHDEEEMVTLMYKKWIRYTSGIDTLSLLSDSVPPPLAYTSYHPAKGLPKGLWSCDSLIDMSFYFPDDSSHVYHYLPDDRYIIFRKMELTTLGNNLFVHMTMHHGGEWYQITQLSDSVMTLHLMLDIPEQTTLTYHYRGGLSASDSITLFMADYNDSSETAFLKRLWSDTTGDSRVVRW